MLLSSIGLVFWFLHGLAAYPVEDPKLFGGDMILEPDQMWAIEKGGDVNPNIPLAATHSNLWPLTIAYEFDPVINNSSRAVSVINQAIADYEKYTCLRFVKRTNEKEYLKFYKGGGCSSHVGYYKNRVNWISLAGGCWYKGIVIHEIAHSLGFYHEQSRPDRDHYVKIIWDNIPDRLEYNFRKHGSNINSMNVPYDFLSVMHYGRTAFGSGRITIQTIDPKNQYKIGQRGGFSNLDILQMNLLYKCPGFTKPPPGTLPPLPTTMAPSTNPVTPVKGSQFLIRHISGLCVAIRADKRLHLTSDCKDHFKLTATKALQHISSGQCVIPERISSNAYLKLTTDCTTKFEQTSSFSVKHVSSGKCLHPEGGRIQPSVNTKVVIHSGCGERRLQFKFEFVVITKPPTTAPPTTEETFSINTLQWFNVLPCDAQVLGLIQPTAVTRKFTLDHQAKNLKHIKSGKCVVPESTRDNALIKLDADCSSNNSRFSQTQKYSAKHITTGKCIHPLGGNLRPRSGTKIVIYRGCDQDRLQFKFIYG
eukprot:Seg2370.3 transcript_id=Seg2370.3/GoldUCD/mRNA.D3Y31 product="High choriolytic enzyme 1" protein_id=Seg2370.3/GoldUCD/D3Y31